MIKSKLTVYIIYYTDKNNDDDVYEVYGYNNLLSAIKWLHSDEVKARKIHIYIKEVKILKIIKMM